MRYDGSTQRNFFFSKKTKKNLLKTQHVDTYEQNGAFSSGKDVDRSEFLKTIKWCTDNNIRIEIVVKPGSPETFALFYVLQKYWVKFITMQKFLEGFPLLGRVEIRHFIVLPKPKVLLMVNEQSQEIFSMPLLSTEVNQIKYF